MPAISPNPSDVSTTEATDFATSVALLTAMPKSAFKSRHIIRSVARHADHMLLLLQGLYNIVFVLRCNFREYLSILNVFSQIFETSLKLTALSPIPTFLIWL